MTPTVQKENLPPQIPDLIYITKEDKVVCVYSKELLGHKIPKGAVIVGGSYVMSRSQQSAMVSLEKCARAAKQAWLLKDNGDYHEIAKSVLESLKQQGVKIEYDTPHS